MNLDKENLRKSCWGYSIGFSLSLILTLIAYYFVIQKSFSKDILFAMVSGFAILQAFVQLFLFLHLGQEKKPRWGFHTFLMMILILFIVVFGSLWIMYSLDYRMMPEM